MTTGARPLDASARGSGASEIEALEHQIAALKAELEEKSAEAAVLHEVTAGVAAASDSGAMLQFIAEMAVRVTETDSASIYVFDKGKRRLMLRAVFDAASGGEVTPVALGVGEGITGWVARENMPVVLEREAYKDTRFKRLPDLRDQLFQSFVSVPMIAQKEMIGVLNVKTRARRSYSPQTVRLLAAVAGQAAAAIQGVRLQESARVTRDQLSAISEVSKTVTSNLYMEEILQLVVTLTARTFNFKICSVMLLDADRGELVIKATQSKSRDYLSKPPLRVGESVAGRALQESQIIVVPDVKKHAEYRFPDIAEKEGLCSMICLPLIYRAESIGVLNCYTEGPRSFSREETHTLQTIANQAAISIQNAKLMVRSAIIQEMHHRVKNSLQTVASLLRIQLNRPGEGTPEEMLRESINRIVSISAVHDLLSREELDQVSLRQVAGTIVTLTTQSLARSDQQLATRITGDDVVLPASKATSIALILNELVQNAIEHGFAGRPKGSLDVSIRLVGPRVELQVSNDGAPAPADFDPSQTSSLGLQIVETIAKNDLGGRFSLETTDITRATVVFIP